MLCSSPPPSSLLSLCPPATISSPCRNRPLGATTLPLQGIVYWDPPAAAVEAASQAVRADVHVLSQYGPDEGLPALREALRHKLVKENGLHGVRAEAAALSTAALWQRRLLPDY